METCAGVDGVDRFIVLCQIVNEGVGHVEEIARRSIDRKGKDSLKREVKKDEPKHRDHRLARFVLKDKLVADIINMGLPLL